VADGRRDRHVCSQRRIGHDRLADSSAQSD
jgi:hypothetical protein